MDKQLYLEIATVSELKTPYANPMYLDILHGELADHERLSNFYNPTPDAYDDNVYYNAEYCDPNYWLDI